MNNLNLNDVLQSLQQNRVLGRVLQFEGDGGLRLVPEILGIEGYFQIGGNGERQTCGSDDFRYRLRHFPTPRELLLTRLRQTRRRRLLQNRG